MTNPHGPGRPRRGAETAGFALLLLGAAGVQTLAATGPDVTSLLLLALGALVAVAAWVRPAAAFKYLASADAAVLVLVATGALTFLGTVFLQGLSHGDLVQTYGGLAVPLEALHLDDVFHSAPFALCLGLLGVTSVVTVVQRRRGLARWKHAGILATHISVVLILIGGLIGMLSGEKGMMHLQVGDAADSFLLRPTAEAPRGEVLPLGFEVRLDSFELDRHDPEYRFYTYDRPPGGDLTVLRSDAAEVGAFVGLPAEGSGTTVRVDRVYRSLRRAGEGVHLLRSGGAQAPVALGDTQALADGRRLVVRRFLPDFTYDIEKKRATSRSNDPVNPALEVELIDGARRSLHYLFGRSDIREVMSGRQHPALAGVTYAYRAAPRTDGSADYVDDPDGPPNPAVAVTVQLPDKREARLILRARQPRPLPLGDDRILVYRDKPNDIKNYESQLSVLVDGRVEASQLVRVNEPMSYAGYDFYQSNFDPDNPNYSGIQVVRDPGLPFVTLGLWLLLAGVFHTVALRRRRAWARKRHTTHPDGWKGATQEVLA